MIDTIILRIENLNANRELVEALQSRQGYAVAGKKVNPEFFGVHSGKKSDHAMNLLFNEATGKTINTFKFKKIPSHTYETTVYIDFVNDSIRINMSMPKYAYGNNVKLLIDSRSTAQTISGAYKDVYNEFIRVIKGFFESDLAVVPQYDTIYIERIDCCYNSYKRSNEICKEELSRMRSIRPKNMRIETSTFNDYQSTLFFKTQMHSKKVYLKGVEFKKHDKPKLKKFGVDTTRIEEYAMRCMRFEITNRSTAITYYLRRDQIKKFGLQNIFDLSIDEQREYLFNEIAQRDMNAVKRILVTNSIPIGSKMENSFAVKWLVKYLIKPAYQKVELCLKSPERQIDEKYKGNKFYFRKYIEFSPYVLKIFLQNLESFVNDMSVIDLDVKTLSNGCKKYWSLAQRYSDSDLLNMGIFERQTIYNYRSELKKKSKGSKKMISHFNANDFFALH